MKSNKITTLKKYFILIACMIIAFVACKKDATVDNDTFECQDFAWAENVFNDATSMMDEAAITNNLSLYDTVSHDSTVSPCCMIHRYTANNSDPDTIIIDFGPSDCFCADNKYRKGQIIAIYNPPFYTDSLNVINLSFNNYYVNDNLVQGTKTITNLGRNAMGQYQYSSVVNGSITNISNQLMSFKSNENKLWTVGDTALVWYNDVYQITGSSSGTSFNGIGFTDSITTPLTIEGSCHFIVSGILSITPAGKSARTIDFGTGTCDANMTVTISGKDYLVGMH